MSKHTFTIEAEFDSSESYEEFVGAVIMYGGEITDESTDF